MIVTLGGLPGSGKTSVARELASRYGFTIISAGEQFRKLAQERGMTLQEFGEMAERDSSIDLAIDARQKELATMQKMALVEGRLAGRTVDADLKVWLKASLEVRARRIALREGAPVHQAMEETVARESCEASRYKAFYGIDPNDMSCYDLIIDTGPWEANGVVDIISAAIEGLKDD
jgi:cytidylate kinase